MLKLKKAIPFNVLGIAFNFLCVPASPNWLGLLSDFLLFFETLVSEIRIHG